MILLPRHEEQVKLICASESELAKFPPDMHLYQLDA